MPNTTTQTVTRAEEIATLDLLASSLVKLDQLSREKPGRTEEEIWNDMEDAYGNGIEVGRYEALREVRAIVAPLVRRLRLRRR